MTEGYFRKKDYTANIVGEDLEDFILKMGGHVIALAVKELEDQKAGNFRRPFNSYADQTFDDCAKIILTIKGASPGEPEYEERPIDPEAYHERMSEELEDFLCEMVAAVAVGAVEEMKLQNETLDLAPFAFGCHVFLTDALYLLHIRLECSPPLPEIAADLEGFTINDPAEG